MNFLPFAKFFLKLIAKGCIGGGQAVLNRCGQRRLAATLLSAGSRLNDLSRGHRKTRDVFDKARKSKIKPNLLTICVGRQRQRFEDDGA